MHSAPPVRYMGTKRLLAPQVRALMLRLAPKARVADLFSGLGAVAACLSPDLPVLANDTMEFAACVARARLLEEEPVQSAERTLSMLTDSYIRQRQWLCEAFAEGLRKEAEILAGGDAKALTSHMRTAPHVGNSSELSAIATESAVAPDHARFCMASLYFASSYFSAVQAADIDAVRYAIEVTCFPPGVRDRLLACWLAACSRMINSPGHTAQYLQPHDAATLRRVTRQWRRPFWATFHQIACDWRRVGTRSWRLKNVVTQRDALALVQDHGAMQNVGAIYADPPYTKDQYSRFYHVYETLYLYDFPASTGLGRYRGGRYSSPFCLASQADEAFSRLFAAIAKGRVPFVLSYPDAGLLHRLGSDLYAKLRAAFPVIEVLSFSHSHSTMGASRGPARKAAMENLYVCIPA